MLSQIPPKTIPPRAGDVIRSCADVTRLHDLLGLTCSTTLRDGLTMLLTAEGVSGQVLEPITA